MPRYAVIIYERVPVPDLPTEIMAAHGALPDRIAEAGGRVVAGLAVGPNSTATAIREELVTDGPFVTTDEEMGGLFIIEARDLDHAVSLAKMTPIAEGGVDVRPLTGFEVLQND